MLHYVFISSQQNEDPEGVVLLASAKRLGIAEGISSIRTAKVYRLEGCTHAEAKRFAATTLHDAKTEIFSIGRAPFKEASHVIHVAYKPAVTNPESGSIRRAAEIEGVSLSATDSSVLYAFYGDHRYADAEQVCRRLRVNDTVQEIAWHKAKTLHFGSGVGPIKTVPLRGLSDEVLQTLSTDMAMYLPLPAMQAIRAEYMRLGRDPTDGELSYLATAWGNHCRHVEFSRPVILDGHHKPSFFDRIKDTYRKHPRSDVLSAFSDNAGIVRFYDGWAIAAKGETHNAPSKAEPYGGSATAVGGLLRDLFCIDGVAKPVLLADVFCLATPHLPPERVPEGCLPPDYLMRRVLEGTSDYGNCVGVPTGNVTFFFDDDFRASPTVLSVGWSVLRESRMTQAKPQKGDALLLVGGDGTGRDGIHGATFSSVATDHATASVHSAAVQIGNAFEEKRLIDAVRECGEESLVRALTDCGAGGFVLAATELAGSGGCHLFLDAVPLKYAGLASWEIALAESQERAVIAAAPMQAKQIIKICKEHGVSAVVAGVAADNGRILVTHGQDTLISVDTAFVEAGPPLAPQVISPPAGRKQSDAFPDYPSDLEEHYLAVLRHPNLCAKESVVSLYDYGVQGGSVLAPYTGPDFDCPNEAMVVTPIVESRCGLVGSIASHPGLCRIDPRQGAEWVVALAVSRLVAHGGDPRNMWFLDNFVSGVLGDPSNAWAIDQMIDGACEAVIGYRSCFISGKDSGGSTHRCPDGSVIHVPPGLHVTAFGKVFDVRTTISADFKEAGSKIVLVGRPDLHAMGGSAYFDILGETGGSVPNVQAPWASLVTAVHLREFAKEGKILAVSAIGIGGIAASLAKMCHSGIGAEIDLTGMRCRSDFAFFNETAGCYLLEMHHADLPLLRLVPHVVLGETFSANDPCISVTGHRDPTIFGGDICVAAIRVADAKRMTRLLIQETL